LNVSDIEGGCGKQGTVWFVDLDRYDGTRLGNISIVLDRDGERH
jgi:hypothetical protein